MAVIKLQYSLLYEPADNYLIQRIIHGFKPGKIEEFCITNKWVWDEEGNEIEDGFYQVTEIMREDQVLACSSSNLFQVKLSHTHHNHFKEVEFEKGDYRIRVALYNKLGQMIKSGSLDYPLFVRDK